VPAWAFPGRRTRGQCWSCVSDRAEPEAGGCLDRGRGVVKKERSNSRPRSLQRESVSAGEVSPATIAPAPHRPGPSAGREVGRGRFRTRGMTSRGSMRRCSSRPRFKAARAADRRRPALATRELGRFRELVKRGAAHEARRLPARGADFYGRSFRVDARRARVRADTETLVDVGLA